jgi:hypothetical protein
MDTSDQLKIDKLPCMVLELQAFVFLYFKQCMQPVYSNDIFRKFQDFILQKIINEKNN